VKSKAVARAFGRVLREARQARGLSQEALAGEADVDRTYPSLLERGLREPTLDVFFRLCRAVRRPPADVLNATLTQLSRAQPLPAALRSAPAPPPPPVLPPRAQGEL
jgi:transcriptional regulator with XRE-family HTH domain